MITKRTVMIVTAITAALALLGSGCAVNRGLKDSEKGGPPAVISPVTIVGRVSKVTDQGLSLVILDPGELGNSTTRAHAQHVVTNEKTDYIIAEIGPSGTLVPRTAMKTSLKIGSIVTVEAKIELGDAARIVALKVTLSPAVDVMAKAKGVDHGREAVISGNVTTVKETGFEIDSITGSTVLVIADGKTPTMAGPPGVSPSPADYASVRAGVQVTVLGVWDAEGVFKATQIAVTK